MRKYLFPALLSLLLLGLCACGSRGTVETVSIAVDAKNAKYWYVSGAELDPAGLVVTATLADGSTKTVPVEECTLEKPPFFPSGEKEVKVTWGECEASYPVYVCASSTETDEYVSYQIRKNENDSRVSLTPVLVGEGRPFVLIFPGGGYQACNPYGNEGYAYAAEMKKAGYNAFILEYSINMEHPAPLDDVNTALEIIEDNRAFFDVTMQDYAVMGSSAGGHLAATWSTKGVGYEHYGKEKPAVVLLSYAATHIFDGSRSNLVGDNPSEELRRSLSADENVDADYPPTYQWVFDEDNLGVAAHTALMDAALAAAGVEHSTNIYPGTAHGVGLAEGTSAEGWIDDAISFWRAQMEK